MQPKHFLQKSANLLCQPKWDREESVRSDKCLRTGWFVFGLPYHCHICSPRWQSSVKYSAEELSTFPGQSKQFRRRDKHEGWAASENQFHSSKISCETFLWFWLCRVSPWYVLVHIGMWHTAQLRCAPEEHPRDKLANDVLCRVAGSISRVFSFATLNYMATLHHSRGFWRPNIVVHPHLEAETMTLLSSASHCFRADM